MAFHQLRYRVEGTALVLLSAVLLRAEIPETRLNKEHGTGCALTLNQNTGDVVAGMRTVCTEHWLVRMAIGEACQAEA